MFWTLSLGVRPNCMQKALFVLLSVVLVACSGEEKVNLPDEPETPKLRLHLQKVSINIYCWMLLAEL